MQFKGPVVYLNTCLNGKKDGDETDEDCGGECAGAGFPCEPNKKCAADSDCRGVVPCMDGICGLDGLTQETAGKTCKAINIHQPESKNGFYWVTGPKVIYNSLIRYKILYSFMCLVALVVTSPGM